MSIADFLNRTATIRSFTEVDDDYSDDTDRTWSDLLTNVACRIRKLTAKEEEEYLKRNVKATHRMYILPPSLTITEKMRVVSEGKTFDIIHVDDWNFQGIYFMIDMEEVAWE